MTLYLLVATNDDGENLDMFVTADSPEQAVTLLLAAEKMDENPMITSHYEPYRGPIVAPADYRYTDPRHDEVMRIFEIRASGTPGVMAWEMPGHPTTKAAGHALLVGMIPAT